MDMNGEKLVPAPRAAVWAALNDPEILRQCIAGCETVTRVSDTEFEAAVTVKVGPVKAKFKGKVTLSDIDPPNGYTISGEAQGGVAAGFGKGSAKVALADGDGGTLLTYTVNAQVGGKLAQIGARLIDATAAKMAEDFFQKFNELVGAAAQQNSAIETAQAAPAPETATEPSGTAASHAPAAPQIEDPAPEKGGLPAWAWIGGLVIVVALVTLMVLRR